MCSDDTSLDPTLENDDNPSATPQDNSKTGSTGSWPRRKFLAAAALGTAAAVLVSQKGAGLGDIQLGPLAAFANDLSNSPCTAQDVEIIGTGITQNEPCICSGTTFTAHVQFTVRNNTSTGRYCISLHLPGGFGVPAQDVVLRDSSGKSIAPGKSGGASFQDTIMFGDITGFPCNSGGTLVCIGQSGVTTGKCAPNTCTTIAWNTSPGAATCTTADQNPPGGQCRHQGICIQGYGATLTCKSGCTPTCGGTAVLTATVNGGVSPYVFVLTGSDGTSQTYPASGSTTDTSHDFTVTVTQNTTYTLTVTDKNGCSRTATTSLSASPVAAPVLSLTGPDCGGSTTIAVTNCTAGLTYTFAEGSTTLQSSSACSFTGTFATGAHTVTVTASTGTSTACDQTASVDFTVLPQVTVALSAPTAGCNGVVTLTATGGGGDGTFTYTFTGASGSVSGDTITLQPQLDGNCRTVTVTATSHGCTSAAASRSFSQCVTTTVC